MVKRFLILACFFSLALTSIASADNLGLGFEWSTGPDFTLTSGYTSGYFGNNFALSWMVGDNLSVGVFGQTVNVRGTNSYTTATGAGGANTTYNLVNAGSMSATGLRLLANTPWTIPMTESLQLGLDIGTASFTTANTYNNTGAASTVVGSPSAADFGIAAATALNTTAPLLGFAARVTLISAKSKGIWTDVNVGADFHFVTFADTYALGKSQVNQAGGAVPPSISAVNSFNNLNLKVGITIGF